MSIRTVVSNNDIHFCDNYSLNEIRMMQRFQQTAGKTVLTYGTKRCPLVVVAGVDKVVVNEEHVIRRLIHSPNQHAEHTKIDFYTDDYLATKFGYRSVQSPSICVDLAGTEHLTYPIGSNLDILSSPEVQKILSTKANSIPTNVVETGLKKAK
jgi:hypothetical protein